MDILDRISMLLGNREQKELTKYLGLNSVAFSEWKSGKSKSYRKYLIEIADFFNISIDYLVYGKEKNSSTDNLSENEREMLDVFSKFNEREQIKLIGKLEELYRQKQIKESQQPAALKVSRSPDRKFRRTEISKEELEKINNLPEDNDI
ncbi:MAG: hypothetical protein BHV95_03280 [Clostridiales bacterium Nov_37_41]|nr:helix-turn-helix domain-containing protein [Oscillospiraceae bacterium]OLA00355.1 MAG: hypothetical protein BHV95_03280 [Clostridiales bacterium Nov_37_41]